MSDRFTWGENDLPKSGIGSPPDVAGKDVIELGCGTAYISRGWLVVGLNRSSASTRRRRSWRRPMSSDARSARESLSCGLLQKPCRCATPCSTSRCPSTALPSGRSVQMDPQAARLLRVGGELVFLANSLLFVLGAPDEDAAAGAALVPDQAGLHRADYTDDPGVEFHLPHGETLRLLRANRFDVLDLIELDAPDGASDRRYIDAGGAAARRRRDLAGSSNLTSAAAAGAPISACRRIGRPAPLETLPAQSKRSGCSRVIRRSSG